MDSSERGGPDPSLATSQQILREITMLEEKTAGLIAGLENAVNTRFQAMDKAIGILAEFPTEMDKSVGGLKSVIDARLGSMEKVQDRHQVELDRAPHLRNEAVEHLSNLVDEKFNGIATQFRERDTREERTAREGKEAIAAALQAQKEAVGKTETGFEKRIDQISILITSVEKSADGKINDIKDRLTSMEGQSKGSKDAWMLVVGGIGMLIGIGSLVVAIVVNSI